MIILIFTYYVFIYDPDLSLQDHDGGDIHLMPNGTRREPNPIDSGLLRPIRAFLSTWYKFKIPIAERNKLENAFNRVSTHCCCFSQPPTESDVN